MKALIVDDSGFAQRTIRTFLERIFPSLTVIFASNGREGYAAFVCEQPDMVFTDLLMPEMTGQEMIKEIRKMDSAVPIFVLTADIQKATKFELVPFGIAAFINKPLTREAAELIKERIRSK